ncbi:MAG: DUF4200 domain-containing protein [Methanosarcinales archaeon]|nr:MAG: DUF4200 domain-containing protein [Methanosarcinales archaeon]
MCRSRDFTSPLHVYVHTRAPSCGVRAACSRGGKPMFVDNVSQQTRLLEKRRQVFEVEEALSAQKEEFARREVWCAAAPPYTRLVTGLQAAHHQTLWTARRGVLACANTVQEAFRRREEGLRKKDLELQETLIRFNQIITENDTKRTRAEKRSGEETVAVQQKEMEIYDYVAQIQHMREVSDAAR